MRIDASSIQSLVSSVESLGNQQTSIAAQISSGVRLNRLSDDPSAAGKAISMANTLARQDTFLASATSVTSQMQATDTSLSSVVTQLTSAISTAVGAMNSTTDPTARATAVNQLQNIRQSLYSLANSTYGGAYLFGGLAGNAPFTQASDGTVSYQGSNTPGTMKLLSGVTLQISLAGSSVFTASGASVFGSLNAAISALSSGSTISATDSATLVGNLQTALTNVSSQRAVLNTSQTRLSSESTYTSAQKTNLLADQSTLLSADTASLATQLSSITSQRSALLSTIGIVQKGSLFDYIQ